MDIAIFLICSNSFEVAIKFATLDRNVNINRELIGYYGNLYQLPSTSPTFLEFVELVTDNLFLKDIPSEVRILLYSRKWKLWEALEQAAIVDDLEFVKHFRKHIRLASPHTISMLGFSYDNIDSQIAEYLFDEGARCDEYDIIYCNNFKAFLKYGFVDKAKEYFSDHKESDDLRLSYAGELAYKGMWKPSKDLDKKYSDEVLSGILRSGKVENLIGNPNFPLEELSDILEYFELYIGSAEMVDYLADYIDKERVEEGINQMVCIYSYEAIKRIVELNGKIKMQDNLFYSGCPVPDDMNLCELFEINPLFVLEESICEKDKCFEAIKELIEKKHLTLAHINMAKDIACDFPDPELQAFLNDLNLEEFEEDSAEN